jgi:hypothetical protein
LKTKIFLQRGLDDPNQLENNKSPRTRNDIDGYAFAPLIPSAARRANQQAVPLQQIKHAWGENS